MNSSASPLSAPVPLTVRVTESPISISPPMVSESPLTKEPFLPLLSE